MVFIDTDILIRLITDDIPALRQQAETKVSAHSSRELFVPDVVFSELFFVLEHNSLYSYNRAEVCASLDDLLMSPQFTISDQAGHALKLADAHPKLDFTDCLLAVYANKNSSKLLSFDKDLLKILS